MKPDLTTTLAAGEFIIFLRYSYLNTSFLVPLTVIKCFMPMTPIFFVYILFNTTNIRDLRELFDKFNSHKCLIMRYWLFFIVLLSGGFSVVSGRPKSPQNFF